MENYKEKYEEALEGIQEILSSGADSIKMSRLRLRLEGIFHELKESEDERIRKALIDYFDNANKTNENPLMQYGIHTDKVIAWLEKQGRQPIDDLTQQDAMDIAVAKCFEQGKQKSADKVEPKFHEGEWVVFNNKYQSIYQVEKIENGYYILRHTHGGSFRVCVLHDESLRLWSIKDAKDGDILVIEETEMTYETIFIFKEIEDTHIIQYVHYLNTGNEKVFEKRSANGFVGLIDDVVHPATKEQCDTLLKAMKDAGYEFDFNKKELKKSQRIIAAEAKEAMYGKPAWSEEDEHRLKDIIYFLDTAKKHYASTVELDACIDWLKSLKQRIMNS